MNGYGSLKPNDRKVVTPTYPHIINSLFKRLSGDNEKFHDLADALSKHDESKFKPQQAIRIFDCFHDRGVPFFGRAYLGADDKIYLCGNAVWKMFVQNDRNGLQTLLLHEMVHLYDKQVKHLNFYKVDDLACSEIRAYHLSSNCGNNDKCVMKKTADSLKLAQATRYIEEPERIKIIGNVIQRCMADTSPFDEADEKGSRV